MTENKTTNTAKQVTPKKPRAKKLTLSHIESQQKAINKMEVFVLDEEQNLQLKYYPVFSEARIESLLQEAHRDALIIEELELEIFRGDEGESNFLKYIHLLIIRKFTSLEDEIPDEIEAKIHIMNQIIDIGLFRRIYQDVLDPEEVLKIMDRFEEFKRMTIQISEIYEKEFKKAERLIKNKDVIHPLMNPAVNLDTDSNA